MLRRSLIWAAALLLAVTCRTAGATGLMIPGDVELPPLAIKSHRVNVKVEAGLATTRVDQVFVNNTRRRLEASYIFPLPRGAALTDFALYINGKRRSGEVLEAGKARRVYEDIVRRLRDPGLLEYLDCGLLRMRVFPIEPRSETRVELSYGQSLRFDGGVYEYTFPLKTGHRAPDVLEDFTVTVDISSPVPIKSVYSPTHEIGVTRKDEHHAIAGFEQQGGRLDTDFTLFYSVSREEFGLAGAVQHGASTLPEELFDKFPQVGTAEIHLATQFQNIVYDHELFPADLRGEIYEYLKEKHGKERKEGDTEEQFLYKLRKKALGPFKKQLWGLGDDVRAAISDQLEQKFTLLFGKLKNGGTRALMTELAPKAAPPTPPATLKRT